MFEKEAEEYAKPFYDMTRYDYVAERTHIKKAFQEGAEFGYNKAKVEVEESYRESLCNSELNLASVTEQLEELKKANEWQTGEPIKGREIFARNIANCNLLATYFDGAWRNVWNGGIIDFDKIIMWRYTGFKNNGEEIILPELKENE